MAVVRLRITLQLSHPDIDPDLITNELAIEPNTKARAGERVQLPYGDSSFLAIESSWRVWRSVYADEKPEPNADYGTAVDLNDAVRVFLKPFIAHRDFIREVLAEGRGFVSLSFPGTQYFGGVISPQILQSVTDLGLDFGVEVYAVDQVGL